MRGLRLALLLQLVGAVVVLVAAGRPWLRLRAVPELGVVPQLETGASLRPGIPALAWVVLAAAVAVVATRGRLRAALGGAVALLGAGIVATAVDWLANLALDEVSPVAAVRGWAVLVAAAGLLVVVGGLLTLVRGRAWAGLGSSYQAPGARTPEPVTDKGVWDALDRGDDPTA